MDFKDLKTKILAEIDRLISLYESKSTDVNTEAGLAPILGAVSMLEYSKNQINGISIDSNMSPESFLNAAIFEIEKASETRTDPLPSIGRYENPASRPGRREAGRRMINFIHRLKREIKD